MKNTNFFSLHGYIFLPTKKNPKVAIAIDSFDLAKNAFRLYNPFSFEAKIFKKIVMFFCLYLNVFAKLFATKKEKSEFIKFLENLFNQPLVASIYFATINDKVVLQLQSFDAQVLGYLKFPLNEVGLKHIQSEIQAYKLLSTLNIVEPCILCDTYDNKPFLFLKELDGDIGLVKKKQLDSILSKFEKEVKYRLAEHPRVLEMQKSLFANDMLKYITKIEEIAENSTVEYKLVYEHGDFTPWNIVKIESKHVPFDFEYFKEDGLEYFDIIKYYYQVGKLLEHKGVKELIEFIVIHIEAQEAKEILKLFLIKEIMRGKEENEHFEFEENMLRVLERE